MRRSPRLALLLAVAGFATVANAVPGEAAKRRVPFGFFGAVSHPMPDAVLEQQMALMARSGVETTRVILPWASLEPSRGAYNFEALDRFAAAAARHRIALLPNITSTPQWASENPNASWWRLPPADPNTFGELMRQLVLRYGPNGSFWTQHPRLPRVPIRHWQIWNEQTAPWHWEPRPWGPSYTRLLAAAYRAIHAADPGAKVVAGSLVTYGGDYTPWDGIKELYQAGGKPFFDVVAVHPFTNSPSVRRTVRRTIAVIRRVRMQMRRRGDARKPIFVTELTWPAAVGELPRAALDQVQGLSTTRRGQARRLRAAYRGLARVRRGLRVRQVHWYAWATEYDPTPPLSVMVFRYSGLNRNAGGVFSPMPILRAYARVAARYEGCRKSSNARRCR